MIHLNDRIFIAGHRGLVGSALLRHFQQQGFQHCLTASHQQLDLCCQAAVDRYFDINRPQVVLLAAAQVGGIHANNSRPADFIRDNLLIQSHVIDAAWRFGSRKLLFLGSSCIYPRLAPQPIRERDLLTGALEPTNEAYAVAKIAGIKLCQAYRQQYGFRAIALMPTNLYGIGDNFNLHQSHVLPALIRKCHAAKHSGADHLPVWGSGRPRREFLYVDDLADACLFLLRHYDEADIINVGTGCDLSIRALAELVKEVVGFEGTLVFDPSMPDGTPRKLLDVSRLHRLGWQAQTDLRTGIQQTYQWFLQQTDYRS